MPTKKVAPAARPRTLLTAAESRKRRRRRERFNEAYDLIASFYAEGNKTLHRKLVKAIKDACDRVYAEHYKLP